jgi:hypothetical protein
MGLVSYAGACAELVEVFGPDNYRDICSLLCCATGRSIRLRQTIFHKSEFKQATIAKPWYGKWSSPHNYSKVTN